MNIVVSIVTHILSAGVGAAAVVLWFYTSG